MANSSRWGIRHVILHVIPIITGNTGGSMMLFISTDRMVRIEGKMEALHRMTVLEENLFQPRDLRLTWGSPSSCIMTLKILLKQRWSGLKWNHQSLIKAQTSIQTRIRSNDLKFVLYQQNPSNLNELEQFYLRRMGKNLSGKMCRTNRNRP